MLRHSVGKWPSMGIQPGGEGSLLSRAVDDGTAAAIVLKWQQYVMERNIDVQDANANHENDFIAHFAYDLDAMLVRYSSSPQMAKSLVHSIISNHSRRSPDSRKPAPLAQIDEASEDLSTQDQFAHFSQSDSTVDFSALHRQRGGSVSSASTNATSKYDHLASVLRMDAVKHSFYGSPEREDSPLVSQTVSELPSPETSEMSRKYIRSIDEVDAEFQLESERSTLEILEWSNGLNGFRKAAPQTEVDHAEHNFRFLHPMNKQLFPPTGTAHSTSLHTSRTTSPVRAVLPLHKICPSPHHSPNHAILPTIVELAGESSKSFAGEVTDMEGVSGQRERVVQAPQSRSLLKEPSSTESTPISTNNAHTIVFPDVVYVPALERASSHHNNTIILDTHNLPGHGTQPEAHSELDLEQDVLSVGSSLSAASTVSTVYSGKRVFSMSVSADLMRRKMLRKQKHTKKKKDKKASHAKQDKKEDKLRVGGDQGGEGEVEEKMDVDAETKPFVVPLHKTEVAEVSEEIDIPAPSRSSASAGEVVQDAQDAFIVHKEPEVVFVSEESPPVLAPEYTASQLNPEPFTFHLVSPTKEDVSSAVKAPISGTPIKAAPEAVPVLETPLKETQTPPVPEHSGSNPIASSPASSPVKTAAQRHKAENELTVSVARFLLPFLLCIILYVSGRYYYKTHANIWQGQSRLHSTAPPPVPKQQTRYVKFDAPEPTRQTAARSRSPPPPPPAAAAPAAHRQEPPRAARLPGTRETEAADDRDGSLSLHVSIRGLGGRTYSQRGGGGGPRTVANIYGGKFGALRQAWGRIKGVLFAAARTVVAPVHGLFSILGF